MTCTQQQYQLFPVWGLCPYWMDLVAEGTGLGRVLLYRRLLSLWVDEDEEEAEEEEEELNSLIYLVSNFQIHKALIINRRSPTN